MNVNNTIISINYGYFLIKLITLDSVYGYILMQSRNRIEDMRQKVDGLFQQVSLTNEGLSSIRTDTTQQEKDIKELKKALTTVQGDIIAKYQRDLKEEMAAMTETILSSVRDALAVTRK